MSYKSKNEKSIPDQKEKALNQRPEGASENDMHRAIIEKLCVEFPTCDATIVKSVYEESKQEEVAKCSLISKGHKDKKTIEEEREEACVDLSAKFPEADPDSIKKLMYENEFDFELVELMLMEEQIKNRLIADNCMIGVDELSDTIICALETTGDDVEAAYRLVKEEINKVNTCNVLPVNDVSRTNVQILSKCPDPTIKQSHGQNKTLYRGPNPEIVRGSMEK